MRKFLLTLSATLLLLAMAVPVSAKTISGTDISPNQAGPITGTCYTLDANFAPSGISGSACYGNMGSDGGVKMRTNQDGNRVVFEVIAPYVVTKFTLEAYSNNTDATITATKVEVDGVETSFTGGSFPSKTTAQNLNESGNLTVSGISATESIVIYFDNSEVTGNNTENTGNKNKQICAYYELEWQKDVEETLSPLSEMYDDQSTATGWATSVAGDNPRFTPVILNDDGNYYLSVDQSTRYNNGCVVTGTILSGLVAAGDDFTLVFDMRLGNNNQGGVNVKFMDAANKDIMLSIAAVSSGNDTSWAVNGSDTQVTLPNSYYNKDDTGGAIKNITWCTYQLSRSGNITYLTIINKETGATILERTKLTNTSLTGGLGNIVFTTGRYYANFAIDNIILRKLQEGDVPEGQTANYTIQYHNETGAKIKDDLILSDLVGNEVEATEAQMAYIDIDDKRYLYKEGNQTITIDTDEAKNVITLVFREAAVCQYSVIAKLGDSQKLVASGSSLEQSEIVYYYPEFILEGKSLYGTNPNSTNPHFGGQMTLNESNKTLYIDYTLLSQNAVYCSEAEDIDGLTPQSGNNADVRCSYGRGGTLDSDEPVALTTLPAGKYVIFGQVWGNSGYTATVTDGTSELWSLSTNGSRENATAEVNLTETTTLYFSNTFGENNKGMLDCIYVFREKMPSSLSFESTSGTVDISESTTYVLPHLTMQPSDITVSYSSSNTAVAVVDSSTGAITLKGRGTATITATFAGNDNYTPSTAEFKLTVTNSKETIPSGNITFASSYVKAICVANWDTNGDGELSMEEAAAVTNLRNEFKKCKISSFNELQYFTGLTNIGNQEFYECTDLTSVTIPSGVTSIDSQAFQYCSALTSITIPSSVTTIGGYAFSGCSGLTSITIPSSVTSIGNYAFGSLTTVTMKNATPISIPAYAFGNRANATLFVPEGSKEAYAAADYWKEFNVILEGNLYQGVVINGICYNLIDDVFKATVVANASSKYSGNINIPESVTYEGKSYQVTTIGERAFYKCDNLTSVTVPNSVTSIGESAFVNCNSLTSVAIPNSVTSIGESAFWYCNDLTSVTIPSSVTTIGDRAFYGCSKLATVTVENATPVSISSDVFSNRANAALIVPEGSKEAYATADYWKGFVITEKNVYRGVVINGICYNLIENATVVANTASAYSGNITIPESVTYEGYSYQVTTIGKQAFYECTSLTSVTIPSSVIEIGSSAFEDCSKLTSVIIPSSVKTIGSYAFCYCI